MQEQEKKSGLITADGLVSKAVGSKILDRCVALRVTIEGNFLEFAKLLYQIQAQSLWQGRHDSFNSFLEELKVSKGTASKLITVYETYVLERGFRNETLAKAGWSSLYSAIKLLDEDNTAEVVEKATVLRQKDILLEVQEQSNPCLHENGTYKVTHCSVCHSRL